MWLWRTREKYLSAMTLLQDDGQAFRSAPGQIHRPDRTETVPLVNYIKSPLGLGERPQGERPQPVGRLGLEQKGPAVKGRAIRAEELELVGKGQEVPFRSVRQSDRFPGEGLNLDRDAERTVRAHDRLPDGDRDALPLAPNRSPALQRESPARGRGRESAGDQIPLLADIDLAEIFRLRVGVEEMVEERRAGVPVVADELRGLRRQLLAEPVDALPP